MIRFARGWVGAGVVFAGAVVAGDARAQHGYAPSPPQVCGPGYSAGAGYGYGGGSGYGYAGQAGYGSGYGYDGRRPCPPIAAERRGDWETGVATHHPLSQGEAYGLRGGERGAAGTPRQLDPVRQRGYREGLRHGEAGLAPHHPPSPAEAQGFEAGGRRAASAWGRWPY